MEEQSESDRAMRKQYREYQRFRKALNGPDPRPKKQPKNPFQLAQAGIDRAIGRLVELLRDDDPAVVHDVINELLLLGKRAIGPLASVLRRSSHPYLKGCALEFLVNLAHLDYAAVLEVLQRSGQYDKNPQVKQMANAALQRVSFRIIRDDAYENEADRLRTMPSTRQTNSSATQVPSCSKDASTEARDER
jgi:hypothetical protein